MEMKRKKRKKQLPSHCMKKAKKVNLHTRIYSNTRIPNESPIPSVLTDKVSSLSLTLLSSHSNLIQEGFSNNLSMMSGFKLLKKCKAIMVRLIPIQITLILRGLLELPRLSRNSCNIIMWHKHPI